MYIAEVKIKSYLIWFDLTPQQIKMTVVKKEFYRWMAVKGDSSNEKTKWNVIREEQVNEQHSLICEQNSLKYCGDVNEEV